MESSHGPSMPLGRVGEALRRFLNAILGHLGQNRKMHDFRTKHVITSAILGIRSSYLDVFRPSYYLLKHLLSG